MLRAAGSAAMLSAAAATSSSSRAAATAAAAAAAATIGHKVGFVGLGRLGQRMVNRLLDAGAHVVAYDANRIALMRAADQAAGHAGGTLEARDSPADVVAGGDVPIVFTMLPNAAASQEAYVGDKGLFKAGGSAGARTSLFVDCTTVDVPTARKLAAAAGMLRLADDAAFLPGYTLRDGRPRLLDAPVTGATGGAVPASAAAGSLTFTVGGNPEAARAALPLMSLMGRRVVYAGRHGSGVAAKLCAELVLAASMAAVSEGLALGKRLGLEPAMLTEVLNGGAARTWVSEAYCPAPGVSGDDALPANRGYRAGLPCSAVTEHLLMAIEAARTVRSPAPLAKHLHALYERINHEGLSDKDFSSIYRYVYGSGDDNTEWKEGQQLFSAQTP